MADLKRIYNEAGHGGRDPGAVGFVRESDVNIKVTKYCSEHLEANYECLVYTDVTDDDIDTVVARANKWKADLFMSHHFNAGKGNGWEGLIYSFLNKALGECFEKYVKEAGQNSRGIKERPDLGVLRLTDMVAILNEWAFVDNKNDIKDWDEDHELKLLGIAAAEAAAEYLKLPKKTKKPSTGKTTKSVKAHDAAKYRKDSLAGTYKVDAKSGLNIRHGAGTTKKILVTIPDDTEVKNFGYYSTANGVKWLYVQFTYKGVKYTGFASSKYLSKV